MSIKIVLPEGGSPKRGRGTKVFTEDGHEVSGVQRCIIDIQSDCAITAHLTVTVRDIENLEKVAGHLHIAGVYPEDESQHEMYIDCINQLKATDD